MSKLNSPLIAIVAVVVIVLAGYFVFKSVSSGSSGGSEIVKPVDPRDKNPDFDPNRNAPPGIAGVGKGG